MSRWKGFLAIASIVGIVARPAPAQACSLAAPPVHVVDPTMQATDQTAPTLPASSAPTIARGYAAGGCSGSSSSCADIGIVSVFPKAMDDMTPADRIGFRITLASGALPDGFTLPADAIDFAPNSDALQFIWVDGATNDQEILNFTLSVVAVDLAGNESAPQTVVVQDDGAGSGGGGGCRLSSRRAPGPAAILLAVLALLVAGRRRRGRKDAVSAMG